MNCNSLNFSVLYLPTLQEMYIVTGTTTEIIQHKPPYRSSGRSFSGSSFLALLVLLPKGIAIF